MNDPTVHDPIEPSAVVQGMTETKLRAAGALPGDQSGFAVAASGNVVVLGALGDSTNGSFAGAAFVFRFNGTAWVEEATLRAADGEAGDFFGFSVAISGDRAIVGAFGDPVNGEFAGAAYVYDFDGAVWIETTKLTHTAAAAGASEGAAYVFEVGGASWTETDKLTASDGAAGDRFGTSVSGETNVFIVGAFGQSELGQEAGAAYLYDLQGGSWVERTKLMITDGVEFDAYGISVAQSRGRSLIGAAGDDDATGAAYVLQLEATQHRYLLLAETRIVVDRWVFTSGDIHSNGGVEFMRGLPSTLTGNITSVGNVVIDRDHTIEGDITSGGTVTISNGSTVTGIVTENTAVVPVPLPSFAYFAGGKKVDVRDNRFLAISPGSYDKVKVGRRAVLYLYHDGTTGDYFFKDLDVRDDGMVWIDTSNGPVNVNVVGRVRFHKRSWVWNTPFSDISVLRTTFRSLRGNMDFEDSVYIRGSLIAPAGRVRFKRRGYLRGTICADEIDIERDTKISAPATLTAGPLLPIFRVGEVVPPAVVPKYHE